MISEAPLEDDIHSFTWQLGWRRLRDKLITIFLRCLNVFRMEGF